MLKFLASISPVAVLLIGAVPAFTVGWVAHGVKFDHLDRPVIIREATATADAHCALRVSNAATEAETKERERQRLANADAKRIYDEALAANARAALAKETLLQQENADYAAQLEAEGRSCKWTDRDLDERAQWLHDYGAANAD